MNLTRLILFSILQLSLVFFYIYTRSAITRFSYLKQKSEKKYKQIYEENLQLIRLIEEYKNPTNLRNQAIEQGMIPLRLTNMNLLEDNLKNSEQA